MKGRDLGNHCECGGSSCCCYPCEKTSRSHGSTSYLQRGLSPPSARHLTVVAAL